MHKNFYLPLALIFIFSSINSHITPRISSSELKDKAYGCIFGAALGDMLGAPVEFIKSRAQINKQYPPCGITGIESLKESDFKRDFSGTKYVPYTDDTAMTLCVLEGITTAKKLELDTCMRDIALEFIKDMHAPYGWAYGPRAPGNTCLKNVKKIEAIYNSKKNKTWWKGGLATDGGCGSVMRAHPFGILFYQEPKKAAEWAAAHSEITHGAPLAKAACAALAIGVALCINNEIPEIIVNNMIEAARMYDSKTADMMQKAIDYAHDTSKSSNEVFEEFLGWTAHEAIAAATYIFIKHPDNLKAAIILGVNTPGDSDSIASIAGALVGARVGASQLPQEWLYVLENRYVIQNTLNIFIQKYNTK
jgi:ADP-ribosylglycohydrolase